jgi:peptide-methionine (R)-S-oxide reductase
MSEVTQLTDAQWQERLTPEQYAVLRGKGTERAFTGAYWDNKAEGLYRCAGCNSALFTSETKYESGSGWPSFWEPLTPDAVRFERDTAHGMIRTEVLCGTCGGHLGHLFDDGPQPTGERYCMNSAAMAFDPADESAG